MVKRIAKEWLWLVSAAVAVIGASLVYRGAFWQVGETGVAVVGIYGLSALVRTTIWAIRTAQRTATS